MRPSDVATLTDRDELHFLSPGSCRIVCFTLGYDVLDSVAATFLGTGWDEGIESVRVLSLHAAEGAAEAIRRLLDLPPRSVAAAGRRRLARQIEDYLRANGNRPVTIAELCAVLGVPDRTLQGACREYFGLPPIAFLRGLRWHGGRRQLQTPGSVTETATAWGFYHFGEFAGAYRRLFGEPSSRPLRRATGFTAQMQRSASSRAAC